MQTVKNQKFLGAQVSVDDTEFINCTFENCGMMYGGGLYRFDAACRFKRTSFQFRDAALRTAEFMRGFGMLPPGMKFALDDDSKKPS